MKKLLLLLLIVSNYTFGQFSESFEGAAIPTGWSVIAGGDTGQTWSQVDLSTSTGIQAQNGNKIFAIMYGATAHNDFLVTPQFTVTAGVSDKLTFWGRSRDPLYPETISVKSSSTTATAAAFTSILSASVAPVSGANFYKYTIDLTSKIGQTIYIGFHSTTTDKFYFDIDNVVVSGTPTCVEPISPLTITDVLSTSATVSWTAANPVPASGYDIVASTSAVPPINATVPTNTTTATQIGLTELTANSKYYIYVRSKCSASDNSVWGYVGIFSTLPTPLSAVTPPYSYGFDNATGYITDGWAGSWSTNADAGLPQAGAGMIFSNNSITAATNTWIFSRAINLQANSVNTITFYLRNFGTTPIPPQSLKLTVGNNPIPSAQTTTVWTSSAVISPSWLQITAIFTPTTTGVYNFGFNHFSPSQATEVSLALDTFAISSVLSNEEFKVNQLTVYPNPAADVLNIKSSGSANINAVQIIDLNGRQVITKSFNNVSDAQINVNDLSAGMYLINITSGENTVTKKFLKQ